MACDGGGGGDDSCEYARNGVCDDGGELVARGPPPQGAHVSRAAAAAAAVIRCAWATDCSDCGPRHEILHRSTLAPLSSIVPWTLASSAFSATTNATSATAAINLRAAWTSTQPSFVMPFVDPQIEFGVSRAMDAVRAIEPTATLYFNRLNEQCCARGGLFVDVGANFGYCTPPHASRSAAAAS